MNSADTATPEAIIHTAYALISGKAGDKRDWDRWRALHDPGARLIPLETAEDGSRVARVLSTDQYIESRAPFFEQNDFFEWETDREEKRFGQLVQVWSTYVAAHEQGGKPIRKGVNSIQLWNDGSRWWILSVAWDAIEALTSVTR